MNYNDLIAANVTMVLPHCFETINRHKQSISKLKGDVIECGVWRGGFSIFLAKTFPKKHIWVSDSFVGFQPITNAKYSYLNERHQPDYDVSATLEIFLTEKSMFLDIGSNWGHHSFSAALKKKCSVIAFEPNQEVYRDFVRINNQLGLVDKLKIHICALSSVKSSLLLSQNYFDSGVASISQSYSESVLTSHKTLNFLRIGRASWMKA